MNKEFVFGCGSLSITTPVTLLTNEFDVRSELHGHVSLAAVNQNCVVHESMNGCKILTIHLRLALKMKIVCIKVILIGIV